MGIKGLFKRNKRSVSITDGPMFLNIFLYSVPTILSGMLQLLYNAADNIVIGQYSQNENSLAAVGSTAALTNLIVNLLFGLSVGTGVAVARAIGSKNEKATSDAVHTSVAVSAIGGVIFGIIGIVFCKPLLVLLGTKPEVLDKAALYMTIFFCGMPANSIFNFGASILRSKGDTKRPMIILIITGLINVICNLFFVISCGLDVEGVALATIIAQYISAVVIIILLCREKDACRLRFSKLCIKWKVFKDLVRVGLPAGVQGMLFSLSNAIIQSAVNTFPTVAVNGNTAASTIEGFVYIAMNAFYHTALTYVGQNYGAKKYDRIKKSIIFCTIQVVLVGLSISALILAFGKPLALLIKNNNDIAAAAVNRMWVILPAYFVCGIMEVLTGSLRSLGKSTVAMLSCIMGACVFRIFWVKVLFPLDAFNSPFGLYISYPISWVLTALTLLGALLFTLRGVKKSLEISEVIK